MKKYFTKARLRLFNVKSGQRVLLLKDQNDWYKLDNDGREHKLSIPEVYRLIFSCGAFDRPTKRRKYSLAVFSVDRAKFFLEKGYVLLDHKLNYYKLVNGHILRNGKVIVALPINERYIIDLFKERTTEIPAAVVEKEETKIQGVRPRLLKAWPRYEPNKTKVCVGDEHKVLKDLKADLEKQEREKAFIPESEGENFFWDCLLPIAAGGVGLGILWKLIKDNNNINKLVYA